MVQKGYHSIRFAGAALCGHKLEPSVVWPETAFPMTSLSPTAVADVSEPASIQDCVAHLTALFQLCREILRYEAAWLAGVPYWDAKQKIGEHLLEDAHHAESLLKRLHELKA